jgi:multiple sugar transport system permease protein
MVAEGLEVAKELKRLKRRKTAKNACRHIILQTVLILTSLLYLYTFFWMVSTSLKSETEFMRNALSLIVREPQWGNYIRVTQVIPFFRYLKNTLIVVVFAIIGTTLSSSLVAFSFAKLYWPGRNIAFILLLSTLMLPFYVLIIPTFILFSHLGWRDTFLPLIVPTFFGGGAFNIFLTREFYRGISDELIMAARIDGCNYYHIWWRIMFPLSYPITLSIVIFTFMATWNDFMGPLIYIDNPDKYTLSLGLRAFQQQYQTQWDMMMTGAVLSMIPTLVIFFIFQKYFMQGLSITSGLKD